MDERPPRVLLHNAEVLVVEKPAGLPTTSPASGRPSLVDWVASTHSGVGRPHPTSRLDAPVSGIVTFALTREANRRVLEARAAGNYDRTYVGVTVAQVPFDEARWTSPIAIDPRDRRLRRAGTGAGQRDARTDLERVTRGAVGSLLHLAPKTGRTHQIRVHASHAGLALFGDHAYGGPRRVVLGSGRVITAPRVMLHCMRVRLQGLACGPLEIEAPMPDDLADTWAALERGDGGETTT